MSLETATGHYFRNYTNLLLLTYPTEIIIYNFICKLVDFFVLMVLQHFNFIQASAFFDHCADRFQLLSGHLEYVVNSIQNDLHNLRVLDVQQGTEWAYHPLLHYKCHLGSNQTPRWQQTVTTNYQHEGGWGISPFSTSQGHHITNCKLNLLVYVDVGVVS